MSRILHFAFAAVLLVRAVEGALECTSNEACEIAFWKGSECRNGHCSNPFEKGCLHSLLQDEEDMLPSLAKRLQSQVRVCNSEDPPNAAEIGLCLDHKKGAKNDVGDIYADYGEVRILNQNWESAIFASWIMQILLSEVLQVPATIETGVASAKANFYSPTNDFGYGTTNDWDAIKIANAAPNADCTTVKSSSRSSSDEEGYVACGHVIPEFWASNRISVLWDNHREGVVDAPEGLGAIGQQGIFVPKFTAEADPTVMNLLGIAGEANRQKLAETFLRPTTWKEYCELVSENNCTAPDGVAERPPTDESEDERMHVAGLYTGHFRKTEKNDCDLNPTTCTGHVADFPCGWGSFLKQQTYHHNIAVMSDGKEAGSLGYSYSQLVEMYAAANETKSNLMTMWWQPEASYSLYAGTVAEMQRIVLPSPTQECTDNRIEETQRCEFDEPREQYGNALGACDEAPQLLQKLVASGLYTATYDDRIPDAKRSPAYEAVKAFKINELQFGSILKTWIDRGVDTYGFDPRLATCQWVRDNLESLHDFVPRTYPRVAMEDDLLESALFYVAVSFGSIATMMTVVTTILTYQRRNGYVMRFSQVEFLFLLLLGLLLVSVGSILLATPPSNGSCLTIIWFVSLGYTLELVPLIVKVGAMNRLMTAAKKMRRIVINQTQLFGTVAIFVFAMVVFLILWSALDAPKRQGEFTLTDDTTENGEHIVTVNYYCSSDSDAWRYLAVVWHCILLVCATVLAFQTRNLQAGFSESHVLAIMIYSHFVFVLLRVFSFLLENSLSASYVANLRSLIYSIDAIISISVYFVPKLLKDDDKFYKLTHPPAANRDGRGSVLMTTAPSAANLFPAYEEDESSEPDETMSLQVASVHSHSHRSDKSKSKKPKDVLKEDKVSWGGAHMTMFIPDDGPNSSRYSSSHQADEQTPFQKPVDVLTGTNSWAGARLTQLLSSDADHLSDEEEAGGKNEEKELKTSDTSPPKRKTTLLAAPSLPKEAPARFSYASSRINRMRNTYVSEVEEISQRDDSYRDETDAT